MGHGNINMPQFQFNAKSLFATYAQINDDVTKEFARDFFTALGASKYAIGEERHQDGGRHLHCFIQWPTPYRTRDPRIFDILGCHPNIQNPRDKAAVFEYCCKDGNFLRNFELEAKRKWSEILAEANTKEVFLDAVRSNYARDYVLSYERLEYFTDKHFKKQHLEYLPECVQWSGVPPSIQEWLEQEINVSLQ